MKTIIAGSRGITDIELVEEAIVRSKFEITAVISGTAKGVDRLGERWALENGVPVSMFPPDWRTHGRRAAFVRNSQMADEADALVAVWDGKSPGTKMMIDLATKKGLPVFVTQVDEGKLIVVNALAG